MGKGSGYKPLFTVRRIYEIGKKRGRVFLLKKRIYVCTPVLAVGILQPVHELTAAAESTVYAHIMGTHTVCLEIQRAISIIERRKNQWITYRHTIVMPTAVDGVVVIVVPTIHLLYKLVIGVIIARTALVVRRDIFILYIGYEPQDTRLVL